MKKTILLLGFFFPCFLPAQDLQKAEEFYQNNNFAQSLSLYQQAIPSLSSTALYQAQLRVIASQYMLGQYLNAAQSAFSFPLPENNLWKARFLLYRIQTAQRVKNQYRAILPDTSEDNASLAQLSQAQWNEKITKTFEQLWDLKSTLLNAPIEKETFILNIQDTDTTAIATLFDFVVLTWSDFLLNQPTQEPLPADIVLQESAAEPTLLKENTTKVLSLYQQASLLAGKNRNNARIIWQAKRLVLPFNYSYLFDFKDEKAQRLQTASLLEDLAGHKKEKTSWWNKCKEFLQSKPVYGQAYAAHEAAQLYQQAQSFQQAVELCRWSQENLGDNYYSSYACAELVNDITKPVLNLDFVPFSQNPSDITVSFTARNVDAVYARIYRTDEAELQQLNGKNSYAPWNYLKDTNQKLIQSFVQKTPFKTHIEKISYPYPYAFKESKMTLPSLQESGFYVVLVSHNPDFNSKQAPIEAFVLNQTDLALFASGAIDAPVSNAWNLADFSADTFRLYTLNLKTGEPVADAKITYFLQNKNNLHQATSNENGLLTVKQTISPQKSSHFQIAPKAQKDENTAFLSGWFNFYYRPPQPYKFYTETDLALYRPGQKVQLAVYGFKNTARGFQTLDKDSAVQIIVRDPNYQEVYKEQLSTNDFGTAQTSFTLPETGLLGNYHINTSFKIKNKEYSSIHSFKVEEYKRPEYEVNLHKQAKIEFGKKAEITGHAQYYFGTPLQDAIVSYKVTQRSFQPRFCWWCSPAVSSEKQIAQGETKTDEKGDFIFSFLAPQQQKTPTSFLVELSVRDASGRTIDTTHTYYTSEKPFFFAVKFKKGFYDTQTPTVLADIALTDISESAVKGKVLVEIYELENTLPELSQDNTNFNNSLQAWYGKNKEVRKVKSQTISLQENYAPIHIPALPEGIYKLKLQHKQADTQELIFLVAQQHSQLALPEVAIVQEDSYSPNTQARILIGAQKLKGKKRVEITQGNFLLSRQMIDSGVSVYHLPIAADCLAGDLQLQWFGASDYKLYGQRTVIPVYPKEKELSLSIEVPDSVKPAEKNAWKISVKDAAGKPVSAQVSAKVYDKSLDYYAKNSSVNLSGLWKEILSGSLAFAESAYSVYPRTLDRVETQDRKYQPYPQMPSINLNSMALHYGITKMRTLNTLAAPKAAFARGADMAVAEEAALQETGLAKQADSAQTSAASSPEQSAPRTDFSETAYFNAMLSAPQGTAKMQFTMPQSLTAWNILALAFTKKDDYGTFTAQTITKKDVMVRLSLPRFWREKDKSQLVVQITNTTAKKREGVLSLDLRLDGQEVSCSFGIKSQSQKVSIPANETLSFHWPVDIPQGVGVLTATASLQAGQDSDAEQRQIPILPAVERLAESTTVALENGTASLSLQNLLVSDDTRKVSTVNLRIDPGLLLSVFNAMPQLLKPYHQDIMSLTDRYVPLSVVHGLYQKYPLLEQAVAKLPKRNTATPAWHDNQDPARLMLLEESPWLRQAQGGADKAQFLTDLFNAKMVEKTRQETEKELSKYQTSSGGYSWLAGGNASQYLTMNVLSGFAQVLRYGGKIPQKSAQKALAWLAPRIEEDLQKNPPSFHGVAHALYAAYVYTAFPQEWKEVSSAPVRKWLDYADKHSAFMTPLGQTYAAAAYFRLQEDTKAQNYMGLVLSTMKTDPVTGAYFAPEAQSWLWYNDTIATQAVTLRTLLELRPEATEQASAMVKWLLFNRKAQAWNSSTQTAEAIYALLEYMTRNGILDDPAEYTITWGDEHKKIAFEPFDWTEQLVWTQQASDVNPQYYSAQVTKRAGLTGFATLDAIYTTQKALHSPKGVLNVSRRYLLKYTENGIEKVREILPEEEIPVGAEIEVRLTLQTASAFDFVVLTDPKPAGFENTELLSGWSWDILPTYREYRDASTHFFLDRVPAGEYSFSYTLRPTLQGEYHILPAQVQSMYAPEFSAHTDGGKIYIK